MHFIKACHQPSRLCAPSPAESVQSHTITLTFNFSVCRLSCDSFRPNIETKGKVNSQWAFKQTQELSLYLLAAGFFKCTFLWLDPGDSHVCSPNKPRLVIQKQSGRRCDLLTRQMSIMQISTECISSPKPVGVEQTQFTFIQSRTLISCLFIFSRGGMHCHIEQNKNRHLYQPGFQYFIGLYSRNITSGHRFNSIPEYFAWREPLWVTLCAVRHSRGEKSF